MLCFTLLLLATILGATATLWAAAALACFGCAIARLMIELARRRATEDGESRCPVCGYDLRGTPVAEDGHISYSECGMARELVVDHEEPEQRD